MDHNNIDHNYIGAGRIGRVVIETGMSLRSAREARHSARIIRGPTIRTVGPGGFADDPVPPLSENVTQKQPVAKQLCVI